MSYTEDSHIIHIYSRWSLKVAACRQYPRLKALRPGPFGKAQENLRTGLGMRKTEPCHRFMIIDLLIS